jgi:hypothetical protein
MTVTQLRRLVVGMSQRRLEFNPRLFYVGFVLVKVALWNLLSDAFDFHFQLSISQRFLLISHHLHHQWLVQMAYLRSQCQGQFHPTPVIRLEVQN